MQYYIEKKLYEELYYSKEGFSTPYSRSISQKCTFYYDINSLMLAPHELLFNDNSRRRNIISYQIIIPWTSSSISFRDRVRAVVSYLPRGNFAKGPLCRRLLYNGYLPKAPESAVFVSGYDVYASYIPSSLYYVISSRIRQIIECSSDRLRKGKRATSHILYLTVFIILYHHFLVIVKHRFTPSEPFPSEHL